jgi:hypothetical protein
MKHLKKYQSFINEGAYLNAEGKAVLSWENDKTNPSEVLKSQSGQIYSNIKEIPGVKFQTDTPLKNRDRLNFGWPIFYGLSVDGYEGKVDSPERFRDTMAQLKDANIENIETSLPQFIKNSFDHLNIKKYFKPDYIVSLGSTKGLVGHLAKSINQLFPEADPINLDKVKYLNAGDAIDWEELEAQTSRQARGANTLERFKKEVILRYANRENLDPEFLDFLMATTNIEDLRRLVTASGRYIAPETQLEWLEAINGEQMTPFIIRTSGRNVGGFKKFFKRKYTYGDQEFIEAVIDCVKSNKRMLIVDDNINSGDDIKEIKRNILDILKNLGLDEPDRIKAITQFGFYILYDMSASTTWRFTNPDGTEGNKSALSQTAAKLAEFRKNRGWNNPA